MAHRGLSLGVALALACPGVVHAEVFINELHYDDSTAAGDTGERVEIVATAGESLSGYKLVLYNGSSAPSAAKAYSTTSVPAGSLVSCGSSVRMAVVSYPSNGIQNGPSDGIALVDGAGQVVEFISYEGQITASDGPAAGRTSRNLQVSETNSTAPGTSLQRKGSGASASAFTWAGSSSSSFGSCNAGQSFTGGGGGDGGTAPTIVSTTPTDGANDFPAAGDLAVSFSEQVTAGSGAFALQCQASGSIALTHAGSGTAFTLETASALQAGEACTLSIDADAITDQQGLHPAADRSISFQVASGSGGGTSGYYAKVNTSSAPQLRCSLHQTIRGHTAYPYSGSGTSTWTILEIADEDPNNAGRVLDAYRNRSYAKGSDRAGTGSGLTYNREHSWPNSLGFPSASGDRGYPYAPYTDTHMLYLTDAAYNSDRGNKPYAACSASSGCSERATEAGNGGGGSGSYPGNSNWVKGPDGNQGSFEVWSRRKGDLARAVMYMAIRYEGGVDPNNGQSEPDLELTDNRNLIQKTSSSPAYMGLLSTLLAWHQADPPDAAEQARNEVIYSFQGNRNPFIDHPEWASAALFNSSKPASCQLAQ
ncbi:endonuclease [Pseudoxanthomonas composti]|uniref:Ribonuclease n=1 Tax=Pseudoxanthomonas composti TaxID=2137479 RepID=A0A4Q1JXB6_9GAMM|nr:endonuclease [Pseudoxanthomonas composti]RXR07275.1 ribonuclease [Pseudoxanthomonas composti]